MIMTAAVIATGYSIWVWVAGGTFVATAGVGAGVLGTYIVLKKTTEETKNPDTSDPGVKASFVAEQYEQAISFEESLTQELKIFSERLDSKKLHEDISNTIERINGIYELLISINERSVAKPELSTYLSTFIKDLDIINQKMEKQYDDLLRDKDAFQKVFDTHAPSFLKLSRILEVIGNSKDKMIKFAQ